LTQVHEEVVDVMIVIHKSSEIAYNVTNMSISLEIWLHIQADSSEVTCYFAMAGNANVFCYSSSLLSDARSLGGHLSVLTLLAFGY